MRKVPKLQLYAQTAKMLFYLTMYVLVAANIKADPTQLRNRHNERNPLKC